MIDSAPLAPAPFDAPSHRLLPSSPAENSGEPQISLSSSPWRADKSSIAFHRLIAPGPSPCAAAFTRRSLVLARTFGVLVGLTVFTGCDLSAPPPPKPPAAPRPAVVEVVNLSPLPWRLAITGASEKKPQRQIEIAALATVTFSVPADTYTITQTALGSLPPAAASRRLNATFAPGESYRWPLATLLTGPAEPAP